MMESRETVVDAERTWRPALLRRHTLGTSPPAGHLCGGGVRRRVARAASEDRWAAGRGGDSTPCTTKREPTHASSIVARARRLAWSGTHPPDVKAETAETSNKAGKRRSLVRPKSCGTPVTAIIPSQDVALTLPRAKTRPSGSNKSEPEATALAATIAEAEVETMAADEDDQHTKTSTKVIRSASSPDIFYTGVPKLDLEPYDGLVIQKAPLVAPEAKRIEFPDEGDEADEEDNASEPQVDSRLRGYRSRNGFGFIPFCKMFTKPLRASLLRRSSRSSQGEPNLGVENTFQTLSESERDVIKRTRSALKQRINSANSKSACNDKKKIQLSIVVNAQGDTDESAQASDEDNEVSQLSSSIQDYTTGRQSKTKHDRLKEREMPLPQTKAATGPSLPRKKSRPKTEPKVATATIKKVKKKEIPTIMSEISPVPSEMEQGVSTNQHGPLAEMHGLHIRKRESTNHPNYGCSTDVQETHYNSTHDGLFVPARGELLRTIINESSMYAPVSQTWRGRRMHLEVRIRTDRAMLSTDEDETSEIEDRRGHGSETEDRRGHGSERRARRGHGSETEDRRGHGSERRARRGHGSETEDRRGHGSETEDRRGHGSERRARRGHGSETEDRRGYGSETEDRRGHGSETEDRRGHGSEIEDRRDEQSRQLGPTSACLPATAAAAAAAAAAARTMPHRGAARSMVFPTNARPQPHAHTSTVLRAKERDKLRQILEVCSVKVEESKHLRRRLGASGVWVTLDTLQRGLMSPTEYRVYQDHLRSLEEKDQQKKKPARMSTSPYKR